MKIYLHIGSHKTGTTALQNYLALNHDALLEQGVLYPKFSNLECVPHHVLMRPMSEPKPEDYIWTIETDVALNTLEDVRARIEQEIKGTDAQRVVLSTEFLFINRPIFNNIVEGDLADYARRLLSGYEVEVIVYLRNQADWMESCYIESVKGAHTCSVLGFDDFYLNNHKEFLDYDMYLEPWLNVFGAEKLHVCLYEKAMGKGDIIDDFFQKFLPDIDREKLQELVNVSGSNVSVSRAGMEILRRFNELNASRGDTEKFIFPFEQQSLEARGLLGRESYMSSVDRQKLGLELHDKNAKLVSKYGVPEQDIKSWDKSFASARSKEESVPDEEKVIDALLFEASELKSNLVITENHMTALSGQNAELSKENQFLKDEVERLNVEVNHLVAKIRDIYIHPFRYIAKAYLRKIRGMFK